MNALLTKKHANNRLTVQLARGAQLKRVRDGGLAESIGGFSEWIALIGMSRKQADRLITLYERV